MAALQPLPAGAATASPLRDALGACRGAFVSAAFFSMFVNLLMLLPSVYMLQVYDRVLTSGSESTLLMLTLVALLLFMLTGALEWVRAQILVATSTRLDMLLAPRVFDAVFLNTLASGGRSATAQPLGDLLQLRQFLTGPGLFAFFDAPWMPLYLAAMFLLHPALGAAAVIAGGVLVALTVGNELATRDALQQANQKSLESSAHTQRQLRNVEAVQAMGMLPRLRARWLVRQGEMLALQSRASRRGGLVNALSRTFRVAVQTLILGLGAYLALHREISPGMVIAGSILLGRALAPLDQMIAGWRGFLGAREAYARLQRLLRELPAREAPMPLPAPTGVLTLEKLVVQPPGAPAPVIKGLSAMVEPGTLLALIGPSGAGKSTLVRAMLGLHPALAGCVRLDGAELAQWDREALGAHVGYLPQDVELLDGSISENIARFGDVDAQAVVEAAQAAGVHELILRLPAGYDTLVAGQSLSAGQRQRIGLARALYGRPQLVVLDEPNSNLDEAGEAALARALAELKRARRTVVVVTHRGHLLALADRIMLLGEGQIALYGPRDKVLAALRQAADQEAAAAAATTTTAATTAAARPAGAGVLHAVPTGPRPV